MVFMSFFQTKSIHTICSHHQYYSHHTSISSSTLHSLPSSISYYLSPNIPSLFLYALNTYIHPNDISPNNFNTRATIRCPGASESELKPRKKIKQSFEFNENKARIFRLKLNHVHLRSRLYFDQFHKSFSSTFVVLFNLVLHMLFKVDKYNVILENAIIVHVLLCFVGVYFGSKITKKKNSILSV